ncbi:sporulation phosphorelay system protein KapB [Virgibacillus sp. C22-A2]|uniref:Sporulation phosphorelay system protein KapB n=1 Tax=Virgibacillus tibetensis TaxID=3042313 RepID=A0ABU6KHY3_9BACI|nr:sporulation phosphorelay system protein KapB [Virgibacillus sp. C22-A2]
MAEVKIGEIVRAHYNSGTYIGEVKEDKGDRYLIEVLAVHKHPLQGDLHNPGQISGVFFHERKALAHHEKMNVKKPAVHSYDGDIASYGESLKIAVNLYKEKLASEETEFNKMALQSLINLEKSTYEKVY